MKRNYTSYFISMMFVTCVIAACSTMVACESLVVRSPIDTPAKSVAAAELTLNGIKRSHANLITTGRIKSAADDRFLVEQETKAVEVLDLAKLALATGNVVATQTHLQAMQTIILELNKRIAELEGAQK